MICAHTKRFLPLLRHKYPTQNPISYVMCPDLGGPAEIRPATVSREPVLPPSPRPGPIGGLLSAIPAARLKVPPAMRIPFPERVPLSAAVIFAVALFGAQLLEGTPLYFCMCSLVFIVVATFAFNTAGGLTSTSGAYIFFYSLLDVIIGLTYKAFLREPADSNLADPRTTIEVYAAGISAMCVAALLSRRFSRKTPLLANLLEDSQMYRASVGCLLAGALMSSVIALLGPSGDRIGSAFNQANDLIPLGIILGVIYEIRQSGGRRSVNLWIVSGMAYQFLIFGILVFSKEGMISPLFSWFLAAWSQRYRFSRMQIICGLLATAVMFRYLVPFAQYERGFAYPGMPLSERVTMVEHLMEDPEGARSEYLQGANDVRGLNSYYNTYQGFWNRLQFISADDALINVTDEGRVFGLQPLKLEALNAVPHIFWPNKPTINLGNMYAHEIGGFSQDDTTTGISFSPTAEAFHMAKWVGVVAVAPLLWLIFFVVYDSLFGDLRRTPWGLLAAVLIAHVAPEGGLTGVIHLLSFGTEIFVFCALFATYIAPLIAGGVLGPSHRRPATAA